MNTLYLIKTLDAMVNPIKDCSRSLLYIILVSLVIVACNACQGSRNGAYKIELNDTLKSEIDLSDITIGYSTPSLNAPFYVVLSKYMKRYSEAYGMKFVMADGQDDIIKQITSMEDLITAGVDIMILNPLDHKALVPAVNSAAASGVPVFIVDSQIDEAANCITSVQASNEGNGWLIGEWVVNKMSDSDIKVAVISGSQGNPVGQAKRLGFFEGFTETQLRSSGRSDLNILAQGWGNWTLLGGIQAMEDILTAHPDVNLLVAENDAMAMGALKAIGESGKADQILVVGYDGQKEAYELIMEGKYGATALNSPGELARLAVESIVRYKNGQRLNKVIHTPAVLISKDNVKEYYNPDAQF
jgi:ribose transport system substrate-binding protein